jgi:hypothetical protein
MKKKNINPVTMQIMSEQEFANIDGRDMMVNGNEDLYALQNAPNKQFIGDTSPFIIKLTNSSAGAISNVVFLNAAESIGATNDGVTTGVTATSGYAGKTYKSILNLLLTGDFDIIAFYIYATTNTQAIESIKFETDNQRGDFGGTTLMPDILVDQNQTGLAFVAKNVTIGKFTKATLSNLEASAVYTIKMYIGARTLNGGMVVESPLPSFTQQKAIR